MHSNRSVIQLLLYDVITLSGIIAHVNAAQDVIAHSVVLPPPSSIGILNNSSLLLFLYFFLYF